jgi:hypothetical protein
MRVWRLSAPCLPHHVHSPSGSRAGVMYLVPPPPPHATPEPCCPHCAFLATYSRPHPLQQRSPVLTTPQWVQSRWRTLTQPSVTTGGHLTAACQALGSCTHAHR